MKKAVAYTFIFNNQIFVTEEEKEKENKTLSGLVSNLPISYKTLACVSCAMAWLYSSGTFFVSFTSYFIFHLLIVIYI